MTFDWQEMAALGIVAVAVAYLARLGLAAVSGRKAATGGGCASGCGTCPGGSPPSREARDGKARGGPLITIGPPPPASPPGREG